MLPFGKTPPVKVRFAVKVLRIGVLALALGAAGCTGGQPGAATPVSAGASRPAATSGDEPSPPTPTLDPAQITPILIPIKGDPFTAAVGDFDGDGKLDIATANWDGEISLFIGSGHRTFDRAPDLVGELGQGAIAAADLNADGRSDIVLAYLDESDNGKSVDEIVVLLATGDGTFTRIARPAGVDAQALVIADFDEDHRLDVATADDGDTVAFFRGIGDGTFADPVRSPTGGPFSSGIDAADFNGDGHLDVVTTNSLVGHGRSARTVSILLGRGDGTFRAPGVIAVSAPQPIMPVVADLNGDGHPDFATPGGGGSNGISAFSGLGDGGFADAVDFETVPGPHTLVAADFDGDGNVDLATPASILFGKGDGTFRPHVDLAESIGWNIAAAADLDGDGRVDLVGIRDFTLTLYFNEIPR